MLGAIFLHKNKKLTEMVARNSRFFGDHNFANCFYKQHFTAAVRLRVFGVTMGWWQSGRILTDQDFTLTRMVCRRDHALFFHPFNQCCGPVVPNLKAALDIGC